MNKVVSLILALSLLTLCALPAYAVTISESVTGDKTVTNDIEFSHTVGNLLENDGDQQDVEMYHVVTGGFIITIPERITLTKEGTTVSTVTLSELNTGGVEVNVALSSPNYNGGWQLTSRSGNLAYSIKLGGTEVQNNGVILSAPDGTQSKSAELSFSLGSDAPKTVSYTDTLTFTTSVNG